MKQDGEQRRKKGGCGVVVFMRVQSMGINTYKIQRRV